jgi:3-methyl-2-oxobutanoate hydroxymethyltransferase
VSTPISPKVVRTGTLLEYKKAGQKFSCLTSYDKLTAEIFDQAGIDVLLVGDSAAETVLAQKGTLQVTIDELVTLGRAVSNSASRALVVIDMPFGSYELNSEQALSNALDLMKRSGAAAVKLEGDRFSQIEAITKAGIPVMGHLGFTPQSVHAIGGFKVQGRGEDAERLISQAIAVQEAGAFALVLELVPEKLAKEITAQLEIPTIGIGAGNATDGQILVWQDFAGLTQGNRKFVKKYLNLREDLLQAATNFKQDVAAGVFPAKDNSFED